MKDVKALTYFNLTEIDVLDVRNTNDLDGLSLIWL